MLRQCLPIMRRELSYMWRDKGLRNILLIGPLLGLFLFMAIYSTGVIKDIPAAIVDLDQSSHSREIIKDLNSAENLKVLGYPSTYKELESLIKKGEIVVGVLIPENFARDLSLGRQSRVLVLIDGSNTIYATNANNAVLTVTRTIAAKAGIKSLVARGVGLAEAQEAYQSIEFKEESWYNPTMNYAYFLVLAFALNIWQQCCTIAASINVIGERGLRSWLQIKAAGFSKMKLFLTKSLVHITVFFLMVLPLYFLAFAVLKMPLRCSLATLLFFTLLFIISLHSIGTLASSLATNSVDSTRLGMMIALPSFVLCGYTWPIEAMPGFLQSMVWILPHTWFFQGFNYLTFKNPGWDFMSQYFMAFIVIAVICYSISVFWISWTER